MLLMHHWPSFNALEYQPGWARNRSQSDIDVLIYKLFQGMCRQNYLSQYWVALGAYQLQLQTKVCRASQMLPSNLSNEIEQLTTELCHPACIILDIVVFQVLLNPLPSLVSNYGFPIVIDVNYEPRQFMVEFHRKLSMILSTKQNQEGWEEKRRASHPATATYNAKTSAWMSRREQD